MVNNFAEGEAEVVVTPGEEIGVYVDNSLYVDVSDNTAPQARFINSLISTEPTIDYCKRTLMQVYNAACKRVVVDNSHYMSPAKRNWLSTCDDSNEECSTFAYCAAQQVHDDEVFVYPWR